jgi:hypothetical protein
MRAGTVCAPHHATKLRAIVKRDADIFTHDAAEGVKWLDGHRHLLQEFHAINNHSIPLSGGLLFSSDNWHNSS